jgi:hypothetical protein
MEGRGDHTKDKYGQHRSDSEQPKGLFGLIAIVCSSQVFNFDFFVLQKTRIAVSRKKSSDSNKNKMKSTVQHKSNSMADVDDNGVRTDQLVQIKNKIRSQQININKNQIEIQKQINLFHHNLANLQRRFEYFSNLSKTKVSLSADCLKLNSKTSFHADCISL